MRRATFLSDGRASIGRARFSFDEPEFFRAGVWQQGTSRQQANAAMMWSRLVSLYAGERRALETARVAEQRRSNERAIQNATAILSGVAAGLSSNDAFSGSEQCECKSGDLNDCSYELSGRQRPVCLNRLDN